MLNILHGEEEDLKDLLRSSLDANLANIEYAPYIANLFPWSPEEKNKLI